jgi:hypothetical protein
MWYELVTELWFKKPHSNSTLASDDQITASKSQNEIESSSLSSQKFTLSPVKTEFNLKHILPSMLYLPSQVSLKLPE